MYLLFPRLSDAIEDSAVDRSYSTGTLGLSCRAAMVNPGKKFHSNSIDSPSIVFKALCCDELLNHVNFSSQIVFDCGFCFIFLKQNTESENM